jgi:hypothetical protein
VTIGVGLSLWRAALGGGVSVSNQTIEFGALTLANAGGAKAIASNGSEVDFVSVDSVVSGTGTGWSVSSGRLIRSSTPATSNGAVLRCTTSLGQIDVTINATANTYSVATAAQLKDVCDIGAATVSGKTIKMRAGEYLWNNSTFSSRSFTSTVTVSPHGAINSAVFYDTTNRSINAGANITFDGLRFQWRFEKGVAAGDSYAIALLGTSSNLRFQNCDFDGYFAQSVAAYGTPITSGQYGWRGMLGSDGTSNVGSGNLYIENCVFRNTYRGLNLKCGRDPSPAAGKLIIKNNTFYDFTLDAMIISGDMRQGVDILFNKIYNPISVIPNEYQVISVDTTANTVTVTQGNFVNGSYTINIGPSTTTPPGGLNFPGVGGGNDYQCTVTVGGGQAVISGWNLSGVPQDITSAGTNVWIRSEPGHCDFIQFIPNSASLGTYYNAIGIRCIGNEMLGRQDNDGSWPQLFFMEDISASGTDAYYERCVIVGNVGYTNVLNGITVNNGLNTIIADNTCLAPDPALSASVPQVSMRQSWGTVGSGNVLYNNAAGSVTSAFTGDADVANHDVVPSGYAGSGLFAGTGGYAPTTISGMRAAFARTDLNGVIDYVNCTWDLPSANTCTFPDFTDVTGASVGVQTAVGAPVQITSILNSEGAASSYGALVSVAGAGSPQFRITSDVGGSSVVTDWTSTPAVVDANEYVWVRLTASGSYNTAVSCTVRVGTSINLFQVTSEAAGADPAIESSSTGGVDGNTTMAVTLPSGVSSGDILVMLYRCENTAGPTTPSGWTLEASAGDDSTPTSWAGVYWKIAGGAESGFNVVHGSSVTQGYRMLRISGGQDLEAAATGNSVNASWNPNPPSLTPTWGSAANMWIAAYGEARSALRTVSTYPSGYVTNQVAARAIDGASVDIGFGLATKIETDIVDDPAAYALSGTTSAVAFTIAIRPA